MAGVDGAVALLDALRYVAYRVVLHAIVVQVAAAATGRSCVLVVIVGGVVVVGCVVGIS